MPLRQVPLVTGQIYHVFNQTIDHKMVFQNKRSCFRALLTLWYYRYIEAGMKLSNHLALSSDQVLAHIHSLEKEPVQVKVLTFCLMPNHYHILIEQVADKGIQKYIANFQNSFTRFFNVKNKRKGSLFLPRFKAVRIENDEQLLHVTRYIHLNPLTSFIVESFDKLVRYPYSSLPLYCNEVEIYSICSTERIKSYFKESSSFQKFHQDNVEYQQQLGKIKHACIDEE